MFTVLILGSSFVTRLEDHLEISWRNLGLDPVRFSVKCLGKRGASVKTLTSRGISSRIAAIAPDFIFIQAGANDADTDSGVDPKVAQQLFSVAEWLIAGFGVRRVAIMQLLHRSRTRHVGVHRFNETIDVINEQLKQLCHSNNACFYWRHKGMKEGLNGCLSPDGVHMNQAGLRKFCLSLREAILFAAKPRST